MTTDSNGHKRDTSLPLNDISAEIAISRITHWADFSKDNEAAVKEWPECDRELAEVIRFIRETEHQATLPERQAKEKKEMFKCWRGRRFLACRTIDDLTEVIENLSADDGSDLPPDKNGLPAAPSPALIQEMKNIAVSLLRMILIHNDGLWSSSKLNSF